MYGQLLFRWKPNMMKNWKNCKHSTKLNSRRKMSLIKSCKLWRWNCRTLRNRTLKR